MFMYYTFQNFFTWLFSSFSTKNKNSISVLLLGLDNAGKSTLLHRLRHNRITQLEPTQNPQKETVTIGSLTLMAHDLGGHQAAREAWEDYFFVADAIVFLIDASDRNRFQEASQELNKLLLDQHLDQTPFLILANKSDVNLSANRPELLAALALHYHATKRPIELFSISVIQGNYSNPTLIQIL